MATFQLAGMPSLQVANQNSPGVGVAPVPQYVTQPNLGQTLVSGLSNLAGTYAQIQNSEKQKQFQQAFGQAYASGDREALKQLAASNPDQIQAIRQGMGFIDEDQTREVGSAAMDLQLAAQGGPEAVANALQKNAGALNRLGINPAQAFQLYQQDPQQFTRTADLIGMHALGPEKYFNFQDKAANRQVTIRGQDVSAETARRGQDVSASTARRGQDMSYSSAMTGHNIASQRLALDQAKFGFDMQQAQEKAQQLKESAPKLSVNMEKTIDQAMTDSTASRNSANSMSALAEQFRTEKPTAGFFGNLQTRMSELTGSDTTLRDLRIRQNALINSQVLKFLPPGPATDRDIEIARQGAPSKFDNPEVVARWLDAMSRTERRAAAFNDFKAEWLSANGNPGQARTSGTISGLDVNKGESFNQAAKRFMQQQESSLNAGSGAGSSAAPAVAPAQTQAPAQQQQSAGFSSLWGD